MSNLAPVPMRVVLTNSVDWLMSSHWTRWMTALVGRVNATAGIASFVSLTKQSAPMATTNVAASITGGAYRVSYALNVTRAATISSSFTVTVGWTCNGVACSQSGAALTGNTTATQQNGTFVVNADATTHVTYAVSYASVGATSAQYAFSLALESYQ